jgi:uncharacterized membrane protein YjfL (UPF0719 family)
MANNTSQHILSTAGNLLGFCLVVITSLHLSNQVENHLIDELTAVVAMLLTLSCIFSFSSIRTSIEKKEKRFETIADYLFIVALVGILIIILLITLNFLS